MPPFFDEHNNLLAHKKEFGRPLAIGGHPDNGLGRLSEKLDFITWIKLQNAQRAHLNYLEGLTTAVTNVSSCTFYNKNMFSFF
jgi:hypothetical protein